MRWLKKFNKNKYLDDSCIMAGILLITHGTLGEALIQTAIHVLNRRPPRLKQLGLTAQDDPLLMLPQARKLVAELDDGGGVLILTDIYGASPSNMAAKLVIPGKVEAITGVNLPMLIRTLTYQDKSLDMMITKAVSGGCEGVARVPAFTLHHGATGS